jgi:collagenase-like PrtC family protease
VSGELRAFESRAVRRTMHEVRDPRVLLHTVRAFSTVRKGGSVKLFSVPADFRTSTIDRLAELNSRHDDAVVAETYGSLTTGGFCGSGRARPGLPEIDPAELERYVAYAAERRIDFNYTLNASCAGNEELTALGLWRAERFLTRLWDSGVRHLTVTLPTLMAIVEQSEHPFSVKASTICQIGSVYKARHYRARGLDRMVIDEDITRDFRRIRQICVAFGDGVEMIVNSVCMRECPNKMFHYNHESHYSTAQDVLSFYGHHCTTSEALEPLDVMRVSWVRPEDLGLYEQAGIHRFKIQGRHATATGDLLRAVESYMDGHHRGNLWELLWLFDTQSQPDATYPFIDNVALEGFLQPFFDDPDFCTDDCEACGHCASYAAASMSSEATRHLFATAAERLAARTEPLAAYARTPARSKAAEHLARRLRAAAADARRRVGPRL